MHTKIKIKKKDIYWFTGLGLESCSLLFLIFHYHLSFVTDEYFVNLQVQKYPGLTGFDSIVLCKYKHVARCVISALI